MKKIKYILVFLFLSQALWAEENQEVYVYSTDLQQMISYSSLLHSLPSKGKIILGEEHYQENIQKIQSELIRDHVHFYRREGEFTVAWEFLDYPNQKDIFQGYQQYLKSELTTKQFFEKVLKIKKGKSYYPIFEETKALGGKILAVNLPRKIKQIVINKGPSALELRYRPLGFDLGTESYAKRFEKAMDGHVNGEKLKRYYYTQCLVDHTIAEQMTIQDDDLQFLIIGSFHSDFKDGTVRALKQRSELPIITLKIIDTSLEDYQKRTGPKKIADYILSYKK